jgi:hypothetical protein
MTGESQSFGLGSNDIYFVKTDALGNKLWSKVYGGPDFEKGLWTKEVAGAYFIAGYTQGFVPGNTDAKAFLMKTDTSGNVLWFKIYEEMTSGPSDVFPTPDGGFLLIGGAYNIPVTFGTFDMYMVKTDASGNVEWSRNYGGSDTESGTSVRSAPDGFLLAGTTYSFSSGLYSQAYLVKTDTAALSGCNDVTYTTTVHDTMPITITPQDSVSSGFSAFTPLSSATMPVLTRTVLCYSPVITQVDAMAEEEYSLSIFPNPATNELVVWSSEFGDGAQLAIYNVLGEKVYEERLTSDLGPRTISVADFPSGIYFVRVKTEKGITTAKFVKE